MTAIPVQRNAIVTAMLIMASAMLFAPVMDAIAKYSAIHFGVSPAMITFGRFCVQALFLLFFLAIAWLRRDLLFHVSGLNLLRGMIMGLAAMLFFTAVKYMPLADCIAIFFVEPLIVMLMSSVFLGEVVGWRRRIAAFVGFCGAMIVIQPSYELFGPISLLPLGTALLFSTYLILTRKAGGTDEPIVMQFYAGIGGVLMCGSVMAIGTPLGIEDLSFTIPQEERAWALLFSMGFLATASHMLIVIAFSKAPASILAPFQYLEIVSATLLGFFLFSEFPDPLKWFGISVIIGSGLYTFFRERHVERAENAMR